MKHYSNDVHDVATNVLLTWQATYIATFHGTISNYAQMMQAFSKCLVVKKVIKPQSWHKFIFSGLSFFIPFFSQTLKAKQESFHCLPEAATTIFLLSRKH